MPSATKDIIQWNANGLKGPKLDLFKQYLSDYSPSFVLLCETHWEDGFIPRFPLYNVVFKNRSDGYGGVAILIKKPIIFHLVDFAPPQAESSKLWESLRIIGSAKKSISFLFPLPMARLQKTPLSPYLVICLLKVRLSVVTLMPIILVGRRTTGIITMDLLFLLFSLTRAIGFLSL